MRVFEISFDGQAKGEKRETFLSFLGQSIEERRLTHLLAHYWSCRGAPLVVFVEDRRGVHRYLKGQKGKRGFYVFNLVYCLFWIV